MDDGGELNVTDRCWIIEKRRYTIDNSSTTFYINLGSDYDGIPEVLVLNLIFSLLVILCFSFTRKWFWNYGRIAVHRIVSSKTLSSDYNVFSHVSPNALCSTVVEDDEQTEGVSWRHYDRGYCGWFMLFFKISDHDILKKCGPDAIQYARFQRTVIVYLCVVTAVCLGVILPLNLTGTYITTNTLKFGATTVGNIAPTSNKLWIHCVVTIVWAALCFYVTRFHMVSRKTVDTEDDEDQSHATLMISDIPKSLAGRTDLITKYFAEAYPDCLVTSVQFAHDIAELLQVEKNLETVQVALTNARSADDNSLIVPYCCGIFSKCCCHKVRTITFYQEELARLQQLRDSLKQKAEERPLPFCLVTFAEPSHAQRILADRLWILNASSAYRKTIFARNPLLRRFHWNQWNIRLAPKSTDIKWENLNIHYRKFRWISLNCIVFILLFFLSTPSMVLNVWFTLGAKLNMGVRGDNMPFLAHVLPSCLLLLSSALLPYLIAACEEWTYHRTKSGKNLALMTKTFVFMLFMILILPSLGLTSGFSFIRYLFEDQYYMERWRCVFMPDNGAFFVNFVISTSMIGLSLELVRSPHLIYIMYQMCISKSKYELNSAKQASIFPFPFGLNYAYMLVIFAVTIVYSSVCPLITPFGLAYFVLKYLVDRYNMYFVYDSVDISPNLHRRATNFMITSCLLSQLVLLSFLVLRSSNYSTAKCGFMIAAFLLSCFAFTCQLTASCVPKWLRLFSYRLILYVCPRMKDYQMSYSTSDTETPVSPSKSPEDTAEQFKSEQSSFPASSYGSVNTEFVAK